MNDHLPNDEALLVAAAGGDDAAFDQLVHRHGARIHRYLCARGCPQADADDLVQETFVRAWQARGRFDQRWRVTTWLYTIARRLAANRLRDRARERVTAAPPETGVDEDPGRRLDAVGPLWALARRILDERAFEVLWLRYGEDCEPNEIARIVDASSGSIRVLLHRSRARLAAAATEARLPMEVPS